MSVGWQRCWIWKAIQMTTTAGFLWLAAEAHAATISGQITYYQSGLPVPGVVVSVEGVPGASATTDPTGHYSIAVSDSGAIILHPRKLNGFGDAINTADAIAALQYVVGLRDLTPVQKLSCDVNGNAKVNAMDAVHILRLDLFGTQVPLAALCNSDWIFLPKATVVATSKSGPVYTDTSCTHVGEISQAALTTDLSGQDFDALLLGDCQEDWVSNCSGSQTDCGGSCVDTTTDGDHCGNCDQKCGMGTCESGICKCPTDHPLLCLGGCRDPMDKGSCGGCGTGHICASSEECKPGSPNFCGCPGAQEKCGGDCVDKQGDNNNCGACGTTCPSNVSVQTQCIGGTCKCTDGDTYCPGSGVCTNLKGNANCFKCGCVCTGGTHCQGTCCANNFGVCVKDCS